MEGDLDTREVQARSSKPQVQRLPVAMCVTAIGTRLMMSFN